MYVYVVSVVSGKEGGTRRKKNRYQTLNCPASDLQKSCVTPVSANRTKSYRPTKLQNDLAALLIVEPAISLRQAMARVGYSESVYSHNQHVVTQSKGLRIAIETHLANPDLKQQYRDKVLSRISLDRAADKLSSLLDSEDEGTALKALVTALEHAGIVERHDQEKVLVYVQQQFVQQVTPVLLDAIPRELHGTVLAALEDAAKNARSSLNVSNPGRFDGRVGVTPHDDPKNATGANVEPLEGNRHSAGADGTPDGGNSGEPQKNA